MNAGDRARQGARLRAERQNRDWGKRTMARELLKAIGAPAERKRVDSLDRQMLDWESGKHFPRDWTSAYATAFEMDEEELFPSLRGSFEVTASPEGMDEDDVKRRRLMQDAATVAMGATVAPVLAALTDAWQASEPKVAGATVSRTMLDDWDAAADLHARRARTDPPVTVLALLAVDFADMAPHLRKPQPDAVRRDLSRTAARHASLIATRWFDMGNMREARRWWAKTLALVDDSGDTRLASWLRGGQALLLRFDPADSGGSLAMAREARRVAGPRPSAALARALTAEAQTLTAAGRADQAVAVLRQAEEVTGHLPGDDPDWSGGRLCFDQSFVYTVAGDEARAAEAQDAAEHLHAPGEHALIAIRLHRAALVTRTDPETGLEEAARIIESLPPERRVTRLASAARVSLEVAPPAALALDAARELRALTAPRAALA
ncbi:hypothetical protein [Spirillospora sp. NPDC047279]|uniref:hypothetical protein n=1 Tax=Spirillospora sp. NPDC047279 TaxID=3155478 RepID=UPI0033E70FB0